MTKRRFGAPKRLTAFIREQLNRTAVAYAVLVVGLLLTALAFYYVRENVEARQRTRFDETVQTTRQAVDRRMGAYTNAMLDGRGLFRASAPVTRDEWSRYIGGSDLLERYPGIRAIAYASRVPLEQKEKHVESVREEGFSWYTVRPAGERYEYFPLTYVEPSGEANSILLGLDLYNDPVNRAAMEQARDTGLPRVSGRVELVKAGASREAGFLLYVPIYSNGEPLRTADDRRRALQGFIVGAVQADELFEGISREQVGHRADFEVFDGAELTPEHLLHDDDGVLHAGDPSHRSQFSDLAMLEVAGRFWSLYFSTRSGWRSGLPLLVLLSGLTISLMLFGVTWMLATSRALAERVGLQLEAANRNLEATNRNLEKTNRELAATNTELEAFSYSVSHDLRAPLRSIDGFSQLLLEDYSAVLDEEGRGYLGRVRAASQKMGELIDALLTLSRVTRREMRLQNVDLSSLARVIVEDLKKSRPERGVEFVVQENVVSHGDASLLRVVLENLLGNAFKFTCKEPHAKIEFGSTSRNGNAVYYVKDNGAGFDMAYSDKLFSAFQRLHDPAEFEGTGIGLATVSRIVHRHGGAVWAEGTIGQGATFYFTLKQ